MDNSDGFPMPLVEKAKCINCGRCKKYCYQYMNRPTEKKGMYFAGWSNNPEKLRRSTSGGAASEIAEMLMLEQNYSPVVVRFNAERLVAEYYVPNSISDLEQARGTKYIPAHTFPAFELLKNIEKDQRIMLVGTPCVIAAVDNYLVLEGKRDQAVLVDFFCAGVASETLFATFIENELAKKGKNRNQLGDVKFRDKQAGGWHSSCYKICYRDPLEEYEPDDNCFGQLSASRLCKRRSCYPCTLWKNISCADIRVGDCWSKRYKNNNAGVSTIIAFSEEGAKVIEELRMERMHIEDISEEEAFENQTKKPRYAPFVNGLEIGRAHV